MEYTFSNTFLREHVSYTEEHTLAVLESYIQYQNDTFAHYETKAQQYATISSILGAFTGAFLFSGIGEVYISDNPVLIPYVILVALLILSTFCSLSTTTWMIRFQNWEKIIRVDRLDNLLHDQTQITPYEHYLLWAKTYYRTIKKNEKILKSKEKWIPYIQYMISVQIFCTFFLIIFQLILMQ